MDLKVLLVVLFLLVCTVELKAISNKNKGQEKNKGQGKGKAKGKGKGKGNKSVFEINKELGKLL